MARHAPPRRSARRRSNRLGRAGNLANDKARETSDTVEICSGGDAHCNVTRRQVFAKVGQAMKRKKQSDLKKKVRAYGIGDDVSPEVAEAMVALIEAGASWTVGARGFKAASGVLFGCRRPSLSPGRNPCPRPRASRPLNVPLTLENG